MAHQAQTQQAHLLASLLASPSLAPPLSDSALHALALVVGSKTLLDACDLIDRDRVSRLTPPAARPIYTVASSSSGGSYTVVPNVRFGGSAGGYCPCPAFARGVMGGEGVVPPPPAPPQKSAFAERKVTLEWLAGYATKFGAAVPPPPAGAAGREGARGEG
ncbi:hypothetical protein JCM10213_006005 [Rhodosporidiobolus nylandii]